MYEGHKSLFFMVNLKLKLRKGNVSYNKQKWNFHDACNKIKSPYLRCPDWEGVCHICDWDWHRESSRAEDALDQRHPPGGQVLVCRADRSPSAEVPQQLSHRTESHASDPPWLQSQTTQRESILGRAGRCAEAATGNLQCQWSTFHTVSPMILQWERLNRAPGQWHRLEIAGSIFDCFRPGKKLEEHSERTIKPPQLSL